MELSTAGDRWEMVAELSRRVAGRALPPAMHKPMAARGVTEGTCWSGLLGTVWVCRSGSG